MSDFEELHTWCEMMMDAVEPPDGFSFSAFKLRVPQENVAPLVAAMLDRGLCPVIVTPCEVDEPEPGLVYFSVKGGVVEEEEA